MIKDACQILIYVMYYLILLLMTWHEKWEMESAFLVLQQIFEIMATPEKIYFFKNVDIPFKNVKTK